MCNQSKQHISQSSTCFEISNSYFEAKKSLSLKAVSNFTFTSARCFIWQNMRRHTNECWTFKMICCCCEQRKDGNIRTSTSVTQC